MDSADDPARNRRLLAGNRKIDLSARCRTVSGAIVAVVWGVLSESKFPGPLGGQSRELLITAATLGVLVFFLDYAQTLFEYLDAKLLTGKFLAPGGQLMFVGKQVVTCCAAAVLLFAVARLITGPTQAAAQSDGWSIWLDNNNKSELYLQEADPQTKHVNAKKDRLSCEGKLSGDSLELTCGPGPDIQFLGTFKERDTYDGTWTLSGGVTGTFHYKYSKESPDPEIHMAGAR